MEMDWFWIAVIVLGLIMLFCCWRVGMTALRVILSLGLLAVLFFIGWLGWLNPLAVSILQLLGQNPLDSTLVGLTVTAICVGLWFLGSLIINLLIATKTASQGGKAL